ncbi:hypothetical protein CRE_21740 [Caenorhabditis remanei]|uniref:Uncharacterized protein n=1 Tax=Caenorhabditis remanei TaxID=31234 RepID=E3MEJ8_CAERE|nr:hypothetical protein CRE_21740 [Caenorhabditis remanei]
MKMQLRIVLLLALGVHSLHSAAIIAKRGLSSTEQKDILEDINQKRLNYAESEIIGNMVALTYDKALEKKADDMTNCDLKNGDYVIVTQYDIRHKNAKILHPLQSKIGCAKLPATCTGRDMASGEQFCLIGPHSSEHTKEDIKSGSLGTQCSNGPVDSGLCKAGGSGGSSGGGSDGDSGNEKTSNDVDSKSYSTLLFFIYAYILVLLC